MFQKAGLEHDGFELNRREGSDHLAPLAGRGRIALAIRVRGTIRESERVESPPHPDPLRASFARLDPASGAREKWSAPLQPKLIMLQATRTNPGFERSPARNLTPS